MFNYLKAEMYRVFRKKSFYGLILISGLLYSIMNFFVNNNLYTVEKLVTNTSMMIQTGVIIIGIYIFTTIYNDDFNSKSMQASIGYGIERSKLVIFKIITAFLLTIIIFALLSLIFFVNLKLLGFTLNTDEFKSLSSLVFGVIVNLMIVYATAGIFSFFYQKGIPGTIVFMLVITQVLDMILNMILKLEPVISLIGDRTDLLLQNVIVSLQTSLVTGNLEIVAVIASLVYFCGALVITIVTFKNRELEF